MSNIRDPVRFSGGIVNVREIKHFTIGVGKNFFELSMEREILYEEIGY